MISKTDWDALDKQTQWDMYCLLLSECGAFDEPPLDPEDTGAIRAYADLSGYVEDDRYGKGF